ncbi:MAG: FtsH protease activity modulator HflK [Acidobacteriota bacterium]|nr:FtsH protease activity modulator HflK [Acidobacteriota bacterium]
MGAHFHDNGHSHSHGLLQRVGYITLCAAVGLLLLLYLLGVVETVAGFDLALILTVVAGYPLLRHAILDLLGGHLSSHVTIAIAAGAAVAIGEYFAAAEVMFIMLIGEGLEHWTVDRAKGAIAGFVASQPDEARVMRDGREQRIALSDVQVGDLVRVLAGERVPVDGTIVSGESSVDQSSITGEPLPASLGVGDSVWSGSLNELGVLDIRSECTGGDTTVARIAGLIEDAQARRARVVRTADRLARFFLPAVLLAAGGIYFVTGEMMRTVAALIVACPCALVLATPAAMASAIARLAREGVLVKGGDVIESLSRIQACALDKTGTLTQGKPVVTAVVPAAGYDDRRLLELAASAELKSEHLLGQALVSEARARELDLSEPEAFELRPGRGVTASLGATRIAVGNAALLKELDCPDLDLAAVEEDLQPTSGNGETRLAVVVDDALAGTLALADPLRDEAAAAVADLRSSGIEPIVMLTGDTEPTARTIGRRAGITQVEAELLPEDKVHRISELAGDDRGVLMVGDGINDAPSLAAATVGVAIGHGAADLSAEAAQVVLLPDRLDYLAPLLHYSRRVVSRIRSSILVFAFGVNFIAVGFAAFGWLPPAAAAIVHQAASLLVILNCMRLLYEGRAVAERAGAGWQRIPGLARASRRLAIYWGGLQRSWSFGSHSLEHALMDAPRRLRTLAPRLLRLTPTLTLALWGLSGLTVVEPQEVGLVQRFGRHVDGALGPGIHWRWPRPIEQLRRLEPQRLRTVAVGTPRAAPDAEALSYEWNVAHPAASEIPPLERLMLTGDENLVELAARVHYRLADPAEFAFHSADPDTLVRVSAERTLRTLLAGHSLADVLTVRRAKIEGAWRQSLADALDRLEVGVEVVTATIQDAHPPLAVVEAFRDAASALEERETRINQAEGYALESLPLARGEARRRELEASAYKKRRVDESQGDRRRFELRATEYGRDRDLHRFRLRVQSLERTLAGKPKLITDAEVGRKRFVFVDEAAGTDLLDVYVPPQSEGNR